MNTHNDYEDVVLGENVTKYAKAKAGKGTTVISVRLGTEEIARLEALGQTTGKTVSQVVREAIAAFEILNHRLVVHLWTGTEMGIGDIRLATRRASPDRMSFLGSDSPEWVWDESSSGTVVPIRPVSSGAGPA